MLSAPHRARQALTLIIPLPLLLSLVSCGRPQAPLHPLHVGYLTGNEVLHADRETLALAVGTHAELAVFEPRYLRGLGRATPISELSAVPIEAAESDAPGTLEVGDILGSRITVHARRVGTATLSLRTIMGEVTYSVQVATPSQVVLFHPHWSGGEAPLFLNGGTARFALERRDAGGRILGGSGALPPVYVDPPQAADVRVREGDADRVDVLFRSAGDLVLRPMGGAPIAMTVVDEAAVLGLGLAAHTPGSHEPSPFHALRPGEQVDAMVRLWREDGRRVLGALGRCQVRALTPTVCAVQSQEEVEADGLYQIEAISAGDCQLELSIGERTLVESIAVREEDPAVTAPPAAD